MNETINVKVVPNKLLNIGGTLAIVTALGMLWTEANPAEVPWFLTRTAKRLRRWADVCENAGLDYAARRSVR